MPNRDLDAKVGALEERVAHIDGQMESREDAAKEFRRRSEEVWSDIREEFQRGLAAVSLGFNVGLEKVNATLEKHAQEARNAALAHTASDALEFEAIRRQLAVESALREERERMAKQAYDSRVALFKRVAAYAAVVSATATVLFGALKLAGVSTLSGWLGG
jgi:hypothetical protein